MRWTGSATTIDTIDSGDDLAILARRQRRIADLAGPLWGLGFVWYGIHLHAKMLTAFAVISLASAIAFIFRPSLVKVLATREGVKLPPRAFWKKGESRFLPWGEVTELSYVEKDEERGGYLRVKLLGAQSVTLLNHIEKRQADQIMDAIDRRFPDIEFSRGFGDSEIVTLGLSSYRR